MELARIPTAAGSGQVREVRSSRAVPHRQADRALRRRNGDAGAAARPSAMPQAAHNERSLYDRIR